jgi:hypothetical protein
MEAVGRKTIVLSETLSLPQEGNEILSKYGPYKRHSIFCHRRKSRNVVKGGLFEGLHMFSS